MTTQSTALRRQVTVAGAAVVAWVVLLAYNRVLVHDAAATLSHSRIPWLVGSLGAQALSLYALAMAQRGLLHDAGRTVSRRAATRTLLASNAISVSLPVAGTPAAALYSYLTYTRLGAGGTAAVWALTVSGICSTIALAAIVAIGMVFADIGFFAVAGVLAFCAWVLPAAIVLSHIGRPAIRRRVEAATLALIGLLPRRGRPSRTAALRPTLVLAGIKPTPRSLAGAVARCTANWSLDIVCLACAVLAVHGEPTWDRLLLAWLAGIGVASLKLTPGGLGVVDATLTVALVSAGLTGETAVAAVLIYRLINTVVPVACGCGFLAVGAGPKGIRALAAWRKSSNSTAYDSILPTTASQRMWT